ncbi:MAG: hypothetical protein P8163_20030 [Candidatus Thiodiazotropha sp.]
MATDKEQMAEVIDSHINNVLILFVTEIAKIDGSAPTAKSITAGIVGAVKMVEKLSIGDVVDITITIVTAPSSLGAIVADTSVGMIADESYKATVGNE